MEIITLLYFIITILAVRRFLRFCKDRNPVVIVNETGIIDVRISDDLIEWKIVTDISDRKFGPHQPRRIRLDLVGSKNSNLKLK